MTESENSRLLSMAGELGVSPQNLADAIRKYMPYGMLDAAELEDRVRAEVRRVLSENHDALLDREREG